MKNHAHHLNQTMNNLELIFNKFSDKEYLHSQYQEEGENLNILFVNPSLSGNNLYKMILPCTLMKNIEGIATAMTSIQRYDATNPFLTNDVEISSAQILWANTIVFPFTTEPLHKIFDGIRNINPDIKIFYNVDFNCFDLPPNHVYQKIFSPERLATVDSNIICADNVIVANAQLGQVLAQRIKRLVMKNGLPYTPQVRLIPLVADIETMTGALDEDSPVKIKIPGGKTEKFRLLIIMTDTAAQDLKTWQPVLKDLNKLPVELIVFGLSESNPEFRDAMAGVRYTKVAPVPLTKYYEALSHIKPDAVLSIRLKTKFSEMSADYKTFIDALLFNAPTIAIHQHPYSDIIDNGKTGYLVKEQKDVVSLVDSFVKDRKITEDSKGFLHQLLTDFFTDTEEYYEQVFKVFAP
jgi:hypothetical protein